MMILAFAAAAALSELDAAIKASVAPCPPPVPGEITVCGKRGEDEARRYLSPLPSEYAATGAKRVGGAERPVRLRLRRNWIVLGDRRRRQLRLRLPEA